MYDIAIDDLDNQTPATHKTIHSVFLINHLTVDDPYPKGPSNDENPIVTQIVFRKERFGLQ